MPKFIKNIVNAEQEALDKQNEYTKKRVSNIIWPSESSSKPDCFPRGSCKRELFYKIIGAKPTEPFSVRGRLICDAGILFEDYYIDKFKKLGILVQDQVPIEFTMDGSKNNVITSGKMDAMIREDNKNKIIEIKSVSAYKSSELHGYTAGIALPDAKNLMQAMQYKYYVANTEDGRKLNVDEVYLMYVNRSDSSTFYFKVDLTANGYPILTSYDSEGNSRGTINLETVKSFDELINASKVDKMESRLAKIRISTNDIMNRADEVYDNVRSNTLPDRDYSFNYTEEEAEILVKCGLLSKMKLTAIKKGGTEGAKECMYCSYRTKCLEDSGITFN